MEREGERQTERGREERETGRGGGEKLGKGKKLEGLKKMSESLQNPFVDWKI